MAKPVKPTDQDCCNSGCNPCIFDVYEKQLKKWDAEKLSIASILFNPIKYNPFKLVSIKNITCDISLYTLEALDENGQHIKTIIPFKMGDYAILKGNYVNNEGLVENISRPYTIINNETLKYGSFQVLIKLYKDGKMSDYLRNLKENCILYWRGLYNHFLYKETDYLLLIGAGTGIIPLYNIALELTSDEQCETLITVIGCFQNLTDILLRDELYEVSKYWNCSVEYYLSSDQGEKYSSKDIVHCDKFNEDYLKKKLNSFKNKNILIVICGPELFNDQFKEFSINFGISLENVLIL